MMRDAVKPLPQKREPVLLFNCQTLQTPYERYCLSSLQLPCLSLS